MMSNVKINSPPTSEAEDSLDCYLLVRSDQLHSHMIQHVAKCLESSMFHDVELYITDQDSTGTQQRSSSEEENEDTVHHEKRENTNVFFAHRLILASVSPFFKQLFERHECCYANPECGGECVGSRMSEDVTSVVLTNTSASDVEALLKFIYSGTVEIGMLQMQRLVKLANELQIEIPLSADVPTGSSQQQHDDEIGLDVRQSGSHPSAAMKEMDRPPTMPANVHSLLRQLINNRNGHNDDRESNGHDSDQERMIDSLADMISKSMSQAANKEVDRQSPSSSSWDPPVIKNEKRQQTTWTEANLKRRLEPLSTVISVKHRKSSKGTGHQDSVLSEGHLMTETDLKCQICKTSFHSLTRFRRHMSEQHGDEAIREFKCRMLSEVATRCYDPVTSTYICEFCDSSYAHGGNFKQHLGKHERETGCISAGLNRFVDGHKILLQMTDDEAQERDFERANSNPSDTAHDSTNRDSNQAAYDDDPVHRLAISSLGSESKIHQNWQSQLLAMQNQLLSTKLPLTTEHSQPPSSLISSSASEVNVVKTEDDNSSSWQSASSSLLSRLAAAAIDLKKKEVLESEIKKKATSQTPANGEIYTAASLGVSDFPGSNAPSSTTASKESETQIKVDESEPGVGELDSANSDRKSMASSFPVGPNMHTCPICCRSFSHFGNYKQHMSSHVRAAMNSATSRGDAGQVLQLLQVNTDWLDADAKKVLSALRAHILANAPVATAARLLMPSAAKTLGRNRGNADDHESDEVETEMREQMDVLVHSFHRMQQMQKREQARASANMARTLMASHFGRSIVSMSSNKSVSTGDEAGSSSSNSTAAMGQCCPHPNCNESFRKRGWLIKHVAKAHPELLLQLGMSDHGILLAQGGTGAGLIALQDAGLGTTLMKSSLVNKCSSSMNNNTSDKLMKNSNINCDILQQNTDDLTPTSANDDAPLETGLNLVTSGQGGKSFAFDANADMQQVEESTTDRRCVRCRKIFRNNEELREHMTTHHTRPTTIATNTMPQSHNPASTFAQAMGGGDGGSEIDDDGSQVTDSESGSSDRFKFECDICGKRFTRPHHVRRHKLLHSSQQPHFCRYCGVTFYRQDTLRTHEQKFCTVRIGIPPMASPPDSSGSSVGAEEEKLAPLSSKTSAEIDEQTRIFALNILRQQLQSRQQQQQQQNQQRQEQNQQKHHDENTSSSSSSSEKKGTTFQNDDHERNELTLNLNEALETS